MTSLENYPKELILLNELENELTILKLIKKVKKLQSNDPDELYFNHLSILEKIGQLTVKKLIWNYIKKDYFNDKLEIQPAFRKHYKDVKKRIKDYKREKSDIRNQYIFRKFTFVFALIGAVYSIYDIVLKSISDKPVTIDQLEKYMTKDEFKELTDTTKTK